MSTSKMSRIKLRRLTKHLLHLTVDGVFMGKVRQSPGNGRIYTVTLNHGEQVSGIGQKDLIARISDRF